jgi:GNAT superfamily N-acetyltransferase
LPIGFGHPQQRLRSNSDFTLRALTADDLSAADELLKVAFNSPLSRVVRHDTLIGMVGALDYGALAYIGKLAVHPVWQGMGIGATLLQRALTWLDARGTPSAPLAATEAGAPLYARFGFVVTMPQQNTSALSLMAQHDFHYVQAAQHMRRGGARHPASAREFCCRLIAVFA